MALTDVEMVAPPIAVLGGFGAPMRAIDKTLQWVGQDLEPWGLTNDSSGQLPSLLL